jgi:aspartyl-tRNA(Asn)/glutamyl-tRNA(Gln) amidotransferase subunit C
MALTLEEVRHIAALARLKLSAADERRFQDQLSDILDYAQRLQAVDTAEISPTASVLQLDAPLRRDEPRPCPPRSTILANAPDSQQGMFRVPPVLEAGE